jgi:hypothetical protein
MNGHPEDMKSVNYKKVSIQPRDKTNTGTRPPNLKRNSQPESKHPKEDARHHQRRRSPLWRSRLVRSRYYLRYLEWRGEAGACGGGRGCC